MSENITQYGDQQKAPCYVRIIKCSYEQGWYKNLIGEVIGVDAATHPYDYVVWEDYIRGHEGSWRHIKQSDCIRVLAPTFTAEQNEAAIAAGKAAFPNDQGHALANRFVYSSGYLAGVAAEKDRADKLQAFKDFVHRRLDEMGIPTHPDGEHSKAGCRIGDRLDLVEERMPIFQSRVDEWMRQTFSDGIRLNKIERAMRFLEESLELCQSLGLEDGQAQKLVAYVFSRPAGEPSQEVGGVMVTLAALCGTAALSMSEAGETELQRINQPEIKAMIQAKQVTKSLLGVTPEELKG